MSDLYFEITVLILMLVNFYYTINISDKAIKYIKKCSYYKHFVVSSFEYEGFDSEQIDDIIQGIEEGRLSHIESHMFRRIFKEEIENED